MPLLFSEPEQLKVISDCIKPQTKVSVFQSLDGTAGGRVHMPWLDLCILSGWSPSYETRYHAFLLKFYTLLRLSKNFGQAEKYGMSSIALLVNVSDHNGYTIQPTCWEFQIKHVWIPCSLALRLIMSEFSNN